MFHVRETAHAWERVNEMADELIKLRALKWCKTYNPDDLKVGAEFPTTPMVPMVTAYAPFTEFTIDKEQGQALINAGAAELVTEGESKFRLIEMVLASTGVVTLTFEAHWNISIDRQSVNKVTANFTVMRPLTVNDFYFVTHPAPGELQVSDVVTGEIVAISTPALNVRRV